MRLSELTAQVDGDPELMIDGPDGIPVPISSTDRGVMYVPGVGHVPYLLLEARTEVEEDPF